MLGAREEVLLEALPTAVHHAHAATHRLVGSQIILHMAGEAYWLAGALVGADVFRDEMKFLLALDGGES